MKFPVIPADLSALSDDELNTLLSELQSAFAEAIADTSILTDEDVATLSNVADSVDLIKETQTTRTEAATARADQLANLSTRVNVAEVEPEHVSEPAPEPEVEPVVVEPVVEPEDEPVEAAKPATAGATLASLQKGAPAKTKPRAEAPGIGTMQIVASADVPGIAPGATVQDLHKVAQLMIDRHRNLGKGNSDDVPVVQFQTNLPEERKFKSDMSAEQVMAKIAAFDRTPNGIQAAGGLCAPVNSYYQQMVLAEAARPVRDALANFGADRGGIRYNPPPKLAAITTGNGVGSVTAAQDLAGGGSAVKSCFTVTCPGIVEVDVTAVYSCLQFGNFGARTFPEQVAAWAKLALAKQANVAETMLLDALAVGSTQVSTVGLVGAGRELFARHGQAAAGFRSRNRMNPNTVLRLMLPAWTLDLVQADFARTFTDENGFIQLSDGDIEKLFGIRNLRVSWYLDSKTGGGQVFGQAIGGQTYTDGTTASTTTVTSATAAFTAADVGQSITGVGIPAGATITAVGSPTSVTISAAATATATGVTITISGTSRNTLAQFPTTVYSYLFAEGSWLHLDAGTLDLGLVRDSTLNSTNQFRMFTETFENAALVGPESLEIRSTLSPDGSYAAARTINLPFNN